MILVHPFEHAVEATIRRGVVVHFYLLGDDTYLRRDAFCCEVRLANEADKLSERRFKVFGTAEKISGLVEIGICVGICAVFREALERIASVDICKKLVLEKMCNSVGDNDRFVIF